ncbi:MAG TPA: peroxidase-related enzyme [Pyrinomonadaceae bacterium]|nr:peroxidase-related enzyme [Pyrinomonadaceae bacterium]
MAHITLPDGLPGITGPMTSYPETAKHLRGLAEALLRGPSSLTSAERELIATCVSAQNECRFCMYSHAAAARHLYGEDRDLVDQAISDSQHAALSDKMKALLVIAGKVQQGGRSVTEEDVASARAAGADDKAIHDTVLTAAAFCMFNRYVDGLATWTPEAPAMYDQAGAVLAEKGYLNLASDA